MPIDLDRPKTGPPRDRWGRYMIPDPHTGKQRAWTRATTIAKTLDDAANLTRWAKRMTAIGVATKPHLAAGIVAAAGNQRQLDVLVEQAVEAAGGTERRDLGTALHRILELVDIGDKTLADIPAPWAADAAAYRAELAACGLTVIPELCEVIFVNPTVGAAGTADRVYRDHDGRLVIGDLKTGTYISWLAFAAQMAIYATSTHIFDPATGTLSEVPAIRDDHTLMVHLPAGEGRCQIVPLSVAVGYDAVLMALEVRRLRRQDNPGHVRVDTWNRPTPDPIPVPAPAPAPPAATRPAAPTTRPAPPRGTVRHQFSATPTTPRPPAPAPEPAAATEPEISAAQQADIVRRVRELDPAAHATLQTLATNANAAGRPIGLAAGPSRRRWHIYRALIRIATHHGPHLTDDHIRQLVEQAAPGVDCAGDQLGPAIGRLDLGQTELLVQAAIKATNRTTTAGD